jgi:hypothetical protein
MHHASALQVVGLAFIDFRKRPHAVIAEELRFVEHAAQKAFHAMAAQE